MPKSDYIKPLSPPIDYTNEDECEIFFAIFLCIPSALQAEIYALHRNEDLKLWANNGAIHALELTQAAKRFNEKRWEVHYRQRASLD